jgi:alkaline phosphatase
MRTLFLIVLVLCVWPAEAFSQEDYKFNHPVSEYVNPTPHPVVSIDSKFKQCKRPKNIILLIGDGMGVSQLYAGITANKGSLNIMQMPYSGFSMTNSANDYITDSAAGGTALASGHKTNNGAIGVDAQGKPVVSILEMADRQGLHTGLVATSAVTHATPASFIAHVASRSSYEDIAVDFTKTNIDVFMGGGRKHFEHREDGRNLTNELKTKGFNVAYNMDEAIKMTTTPVAVLVADEHIDPFPARGDMLSRATQKSIELLNTNPKGFFLMVEGSQIDWGGHQNDVAHLVGEVLDFDKAVGKALEFAARDKNTLVIVTADHETGGMNLVGGDITKGKVKAAFVSGDHTGVMVPVFAYGPGAWLFTGIYQNTDVFAKMKSLWGF